MGSDDRHGVPHTRREETGVEENRRFLMAGETGNIPGSYYYGETDDYAKPTEAGKKVQR
nr:hypothetical protein [Aneurinibacillus sp. XH2]